MCTDSAAATPASSLILDHTWHTPTLQHLTCMPLLRILFSQVCSLTHSPPSSSQCSNVALSEAHPDFLISTCNLPDCHILSLLTLLYLFTPPYLSSNPFFPTVCFILLMCLQLTVPSLTM